MAVTLIAPPGIVSHTPGLRAEPAHVPVAPRRQHAPIITPTLRRDIVQRYARTRVSYPSTSAFARDERDRLAREDGIVVTAGAVEVLLRRNNHRLYEWERLRDFLKDWKHAGEIRQHFGWSSQNLKQRLSYLRAHGYPVRCAPTSPDVRQETGWLFQWRIPPRSGAV